MSGRAADVRIATSSVTGRRDHNEDAVVAVELDDGRLLVAVADGMGGHAAGEVASGMALEVLEEALRGDADLGEALVLANQKVHSAANADAGRQGMGTTLVVMLLDDTGYRIANVGDSRAYLLERGGIRQLSEDHSFVAEAVKRGESEEEARSSRWKDALTRSIGTQAEVEVDLFGPFEASTGTAVMLCSDGLFKVLEDVELRSLYATSTDPDHGVEVLVDAAHRAGSDDNITVAVVEFGEVARIKPGETVPMAWPKDAAGSSTTHQPAPPASDPPGSRPVARDGDTGPGGGSRWIVALVVIVVAAVAALLLL